MITKEYSEQEAFEFFIDIIRKSSNDQRRKWLQTIYDLKFFPRHKIYELADKFGYEYDRDIKDFVFIGV